MALKTASFKILNKEHHKFSLKAIESLMNLCIFYSFKGKPVPVELISCLQKIALSTEAYETRKFVNKYKGKK